MALGSGGIGSEGAQALPSASAEGLALLVSKEVAQVQKEITTELREKPAREEADIVDVNAKTEELAAAASSADANNEKNASSDQKKEKPAPDSGTVVSITV